MSLTPTTPSFGQGVKAFWDRPEGTTGKWILGLGAVGIIIAAVFFWGLIVPFLVAAMANTLELAGLVALLGVITSPIWSSSIRLLLTNMFQSGCRFLTGMVIEIDPIGMLRNNIANMSKQLQVFDNARGKLAGSKQSLQADIAKNEDLISKNRALAAQTDQMVNDVDRLFSRETNDDKRSELDLKKQTLVARKQGYLTQAGMAMDANKKEQVLLDQTTKMFNTLNRLSTLGQLKVDQLKQQADFYAAQRRTILAGQQALGAATKIMKGDPAQLAIVDQTIEFLNNEANDTIGALESFNKDMESYLTDMDIQNGAAAQQAQAKFTAMEQKLMGVKTVPPAIGTGTVNIPMLTTHQDATGTYVADSDNNDYNNMFSK